MMSSGKDMQSGVPELYAGRELLVTGATGFMGKVLLEKLLRCCPDIRRIYILVRPKKGVSTSARVEAMAKNVVFEPLLKQKPNAFVKVTGLEGAVHEPNMGLRPEDQQTIINNVSIVFHMAASLDWRSTLKKAVLDNTVGTKRVLEFCAQIKNLDCFLYTSTAFCQCEEEVLEERTYPMRVDPSVVIALCENLDESAMESMKPTLLGKHPNSYTFTKALAEAIVADFSKVMPIVIARPSIVVPAWKEPHPGWVDTLNGPMGVLVASGKGVLRSMMCNEKYAAECIPVDVCINLLIVSAFKRVLQPKILPETPVYNLSPGDTERTTWGEVLEIGRRKVMEYPFEWAIWYPDGSIRTNWLAHKLIVFFFQLVPAYIVDFIFLLLRMERFMVRAQRKITSGMDLLTFFTMREWIFRNKNAWNLVPQLNMRDQDIFYVNKVLPIDKEAYLGGALLGCRTYCMKEPVSSLEHCRKRIRVQYVLHRVCVALFYLYIGYLALQLVGLIVDVPRMYMARPSAKHDSGMSQ